MRVAHVELSLDPTLRLILQFAAAIEFDGLRALGGDQKGFQFIVKAAKFSRCLIAVASFLYMVSMAVEIRA